MLVNVNPAYRAYELAYVLRKSGMKALFLWEKDKRSDYRAIVEEAMAGQTLALEHIVYFGTEGWERMLEQGRDVPARRISANEVTNIQYTSGTTGSPKGRATYASKCFKQRGHYRRGDEDERAGSDRCSGAYVSLLWMCDRHDGIGGERSDDDTAGGDLRRTGDAAGDS